MKSRIYWRCFFRKTCMALCFGTFFTFYSIVSAQEKEYLKDGSIEAQIDNIVEKSSNWDTYKMVPRGWMTTLKKNTLDTLNAAKNEIAFQKSLVLEKETEIENLQDELLETKSKLNVTQNEKDTISFMGANFSKGVFLTTIIIIFIVLAVIVVVSLGLFKRNAVVLNKITEELEVTNRDFENYRQESRKKHEQLVIQHHKEIKKIKGL